MHDSYLAKLQKTEPRPELYIKNMKKTIRSNIENIVGYSILALLGFLAFSVVQIAEGIW